MAVTRTDITKQTAQWAEGPYGLIMKIVRVDNSAAETTSAVDFSTFGLTSVFAAVCYDRTAAAFTSPVVYSSTATVTSPTHAAGNDVTIFALGTRATLATIA